MKRLWIGLWSWALAAGSAQGGTEAPAAFPAGVEMPKGAVSAPGAWCESFATKDLHSFLQELAAAYGRGESIMWVQESEDLEHPHRYVGCKRTS